jgi:hypothetical protein
MPMSVLIPAAAHLKKQSDALQRVRDAELALRRAQDELDAAVRKARTLRCTWKSIASVFDTTPSAAYQRFAQVGYDRRLID